MYSGSDMRRCLPLAAPVAVSVVVFGGFLNLYNCAMGVILAVVGGTLWLGRSRRTKGLPPAALLLMCSAATYFLSVLVNGPTLTTIAKTGSVAAMAAMALVVSAEGGARRGVALWVLAWFGVATAVAGLLMVSGMLPFPSGMSGSRLQFSFQYANAAGVWYGVISLLCLLSPDARQRGCVVFPLAATLLTQSVGALLVLGMVGAALAVGLGRAGEWGRILLALLRVMAAGMVFVLARALPGVLGLITVAVAAGACWVCTRYAEDVQNVSSARTLCVVAALVLLAAAVLGVWASPERAREALGTLAERFYHMRDGIALGLTKPFLGVGPDNWQYLYPSVQTAQYQTAFVHNSYVQMLCDAGVVGAGLFVAAIVAGVRAIIAERGEWGRAALCATVLVCVHAGGDFDLEYGSLTLLLAVLLAVPRESRVPVRGVAAGAGALAFVLPLCVWGAWGGASATAISTAASLGDFGPCVELCESIPFARDDPASQEKLVISQRALGRPGESVSVFESASMPTDLTAVTASLALYDEGDYVKAAELLVTWMEARPYDVDLYLMASKVVHEKGLESSFVARYNKAVDRANELAAETEGLLPVKRLDTYI